MSVDRTLAFRNQVFVEAPRLLGFGVHQQAAAGASALQFKGLQPQIARPIAALQADPWDRPQPLWRASKAVLGSMMKMNIEATLSVLVAHLVAG